MWQNNRELPRIVVATDSLSTQYLLISSKLLLIRAVPMNMTGNSILGIGSD